MVSMVLDLKSTERFHYLKPTCPFFFDLVFFYKKTQLLQVGPMHPEDRMRPRSCSPPPRNLKRRRVSELGHVHDLMEPQKHRLTRTSSH